MNALTTFLKKLRSRQIVTVFLACVLLIVSTACSSVNPQGANPDNPAVQAGGANNPYKGGGDKYTNLNMSTDPKVNNTPKNTGSDQSSLQLNSQILIATTKESELLYPGAETPEGRAYKENQLPIKTVKDFQQAEPGGLIQREPDLGTRLKERVETVKEAVGEASGFLNEKANEAGARPELQPNPALRK